MSGRAALQAGRRARKGSCWHAHMTLRDLDSGQATWAGATWVVGRGRKRRTNYRVPLDGAVALLPHPAGVLGVAANPQARPVIAVHGLRTSCRLHHHQSVSQQPASQRLLCLSRAMPAIARTLAFGPLPNCVSYSPHQPCH